MSERKSTRTVRTPVRLGLDDNWADESASKWVSDSPVKRASSPAKKKEPSPVKKVRAKSPVKAFSASASAAYDDHRDCHNHSHGHGHGHTAVSEQAQAVIRITEQVEQNRKIREQRESERNLEPQQMIGVDSFMTVQPVGPFAKAGAVCWLIWAILHIWVPYGGFAEIAKSGYGIGMMTGGLIVPKESYAHPTDFGTKTTIDALFVNFILDVGGYGVVGLFVMYGVLQGSWFAYLIGVVCIGIADLTFLKVMVLDGVIAQNFEAVLGPIIWFVAVVITPFGLPGVFEEEKPKVN
jgi:hypothetical protein